MRKPAVLIAALFFFSVGAGFLQSQQSKGKTASKAPLQENGKQIFASSCAGCHGLDGTGGERAPNIVTNPVIQRLSETELAHIVSTGVPGTGMPAFYHLGKRGVASVVAYVRNLQGTNDNSTLPGDPKRGQALFFGNAQCSTCHMASGKGGFLGPDLTAYTQTHSADKIKAAIANPAAGGSAKGLITAVTATGEKFEGIARNEDNFSLQLQSTDGSFHLLSKADLKALTTTPTSIMPSDYASRLTDSQMNDLVSYLISISKDSPKPTPHREEEE